MGYIELNSKNLDETIKGNAILIIDFWAPWCGPCKMFGPIFEKASEKYPEIAFAKCNTQEQEQVAGSFGIKAIPTLAVFRDQVMVFMQSGALPAEALDDVIKQVQSLDMDEIRAKIAKEEAKPKE
ncbi:MAG: thioredoxin [Deltaproteobacteria bacterium]|nr:thioredoxin [Deltaproteobacteria bacterium]